MPPLYNFNPGQKSWKMYANTLTSIAGDDLTITPVEGQDLVLEVSGNEGDILLKHNNNSVFTIDSATATISPYTTVDNYLNVTGGATLAGGFNTVNDGLIVKSYLGSTGMDLSRGELIIHSTNNHNLIVDTAIDMSKNKIIDLSSVAFSNTANITTPDVGTLTISGDIDVLGDISNSGTVSLYDGAVTIGTTPDMLLVKSGTHTIFSIDISNRRVGIGRDDPEEDLDVDGNIQISTNGTEKITFIDNNHKHEHGKLLFTNDILDGAEFEIHTKIVGSGVTQKLTVNNIGAIGLGPSPADYGSSGQVLTSDGSNNIVKWRSPILIAGYINQDFSGTDSSDNIFGETNFTNESWATHSLDSSGEFVAPNDCVLFINYNLTINSLDASINSITLTLEKYDSSISTWNDYRVNKIVYDLSNILQQDSRSISTIVSLNTNDRIRLKYNISTYGTNYNIVGGDSNIGHSYVSGYSIMNK